MANLCANEATGKSVPPSESQWVTTSPEVRGYVAYASRQASIYISFATDAKNQFEDVVGKQRWKDIWSAYHLDLGEDGTFEK